MLNQVYLPRKVQCERDRSKFTPEFDSNLSITCPTCSRKYFLRSDNILIRWESDRDLTILEWDQITWKKS